MHHRNLFYTGVTRAKKTAVIIGDKWGIRNCAKQKVTDRRRTFLSLEGFQAVSSEMKGEAAKNA